VKHAPITRDVRVRYAEARESFDCEPYGEALSGFDRWLRRIKAEAFEEGRNAAIEPIVEGGRATLRAVFPQPENPYADDTP
jgi:hypothetical protein